MHLTVLTRGDGEWLDHRHLISPPPNIFSVWAQAAPYSVCLSLKYQTSMIAVTRPAAA